MTSAYDLPSVQTLGEGEGSKSQKSARRGRVCYWGGEILYFKHPARFGGNHMAARTFKEKKKQQQQKLVFFPPKF